MKIAFLTDTFPALSETFILNQITGLIDRGHQVDIYAEGGLDHPHAHPQIEDYALLERTYHHLRASPLARALAARRGLGIIARQPRIALRALNFFRYGVHAASLWLLYASEPFGRGKNYDIVHSHFGPNGLKGALLREIGAVSGKLVTSFHGNDITVVPHALGSRVYDPLFASGDLFLPISARWNNQLCALGCSPQKIRIHPMGIDLHKFARARPAPTAAQNYRVLSIARLVPYKGISDGIRAVAKLIRADVNIEYRIVGDGPERDALERLIDDLRVGGRVRLLGALDQTRVRQELAAADMFLAPSVTRAIPSQHPALLFWRDVWQSRAPRARDTHEGIPVSIMEAMATGLPVVSTRHSGIPELVQEGVTGFLVPERDPDALANRLVRLAESAELRAEMGDAGRMFVERHHNIELLNNRLVEIYQELIG